MPTLTTYASVSVRGFTGSAFNPISYPVIYYDFNNILCYSGAGSTVFDLSGNGYDGTLANTTFSNTPGGDAQGSFGFNGIDSTITTPSGISQLSSIVGRTLTFQIWVKIANTNILQGLFSQGSSSIIRNFKVMNSGAANVQIATYIIDTLSGTVRDWGTGKLGSNVWYLVTFITRPNPDFYQAVYVNNSPLSASAIPGYSAYGGSNPITLGAVWDSTPAPTDYLTGRIGAFIAYDRELSAGEIGSVFNTTKARFGY